MAAPVYIGQKSEKEKFAGAVRTYCIEAMMQDRKALQCGTSHNLGQNFAKAFEVTFQNVSGKLEYVYATSWGVSTRLIGALVMSHSDDNGLVLPPRLAPLKVVIIPIWKEEGEMQKMRQKADELTEGWRGRISFKIDDRDQYRPGFKFNEWEKRGVPIRIEMGPKDVAAQQVIVVRRDTGEKIPMPQENLLPKLEALLEQIQHDLYERARSFRDAATFPVDDYAAFQSRVEQPGGFFRVHWCGDQACETKFQETSKATIRVIPFEEEEAGACIVCGRPSPKRVLVSKSY
jgi:prolyl-tRNA synthetase